MYAFGRADMTQEKRSGTRTVPVPARKSQSPDRCRDKPEIYMDGFFIEAGPAQDLERIRESFGVRGFP
jgi:hypothetical protein